MTADQQRDKFAGGDQAYLRDVQYRDGSKLQDRANLHVRYGTASISWFPWVVRQIEWPTAARVLEVGCGTGWLWEEAGDDLPSDLHLTLTDLSPGMVEEALARVEGVGRFASVEGRTVDAQDLPFDDGSFDVVVANHMLYHVPEPARAVGELARVLRPDGALVAATCGTRHLAELWEIRAEALGGPAESRTVEAFGVESGGRYLDRSFADVEWREYVDELRCTDPDDVLAFITSTPPAEDATPEELGRLVDAVRARFDEGGGTFTISKETGVFVCRRPRTSG